MKIKIYAILLLSILLMSCASPMLTSQPLRNNEKAFGIALHYSPQRKEEAALGFWFGYGLGNDVDAFFDLTLPFAVINYIKGTEDNKIPCFTLRKSNVYTDGFTSYGISNYSTSIGDEVTFDNIGIFLGAKIQKDKMNYNNIVFLGYQINRYYKKDVYQNGYNIGLKTKVSLQQEKAKESKQYLGLSLFPSFWVNKGKPKYKDIVYELQYESIN